MRSATFAIGLLLVLAAPLSVAAQDGDARTFAFIPAPSGPRVR